MRTDFYYPSTGAGAIHGCRWTPEAAPVAVVQIVHGIGEHVERYEELAAFLNRHHILVVAEDHMGHGKSIGGDGIMGYFSGGWFAAVEDTCYLLRKTREEFPQMPYILMGHSMGSFMVRTILCRYPDCGISAAVLEGTGWQSEALVKLGQGISRILCGVGYAKKPCGLLHQLCFGTYNGRINKPKTRFDWLTRDESRVVVFDADPLCGYTMACGGLLRDLMDGLGYIQRQENLLAMNKKIPIFFASGEEDPVGDYGKSVRHTAKIFRDAGMEDVTVKLYPQCRHELHNELNLEEFFNDLLEWMKKHI